MSLFNIWPWRWLTVLLRNWEVSGSHPAGSNTFEPAGIVLEIIFKGCLRRFGSSENSQSRKLNGLAWIRIYSLVSKSLKNWLSIFSGLWCVHVHKWTRFKAFIIKSFALKCWFPRLPRHLDQSEGGWSPLLWNQILKPRDSTPGHAESLIHGILKDLTSAMTASVSF